MEENNNMPFGKRNYRIMLAGVFILALGFFIMTLDSEPFGFGFLGITLGPLVVMAGFMVEIVAIFYSPKK